MKNPQQISDEEGKNTDNKKKKIIIALIIVAAIAAAAWSWVEKILHEAQRTVAPRSFNVSISTAV